MAYPFTLNGDQYDCQTVPGSSGIQFHNRTKKLTVGMFCPDGAGHWRMRLSDYPADLLADLKLVGLHISRTRLTGIALEGNRDSLRRLLSLPPLPPLPANCIPGGNWPALSSGHPKPEVGSGSG